MVPLESRIPVTKQGSLCMYIYIYMKPAQTMHWYQTLDIPNICIKFLPHRAARVDQLLVGINSSHLFLGNPCSRYYPYYWVDDHIPYTTGKQYETMGWELRQRTCGRINPRDNAPATGGGVTTNCSMGVETLLGGSPPTQQVVGNPNLWAIKRPFGRGPRTQVSRLTNHGY